MAVPAPKVLELRDELIAGRVPELRLQQIIVELKSVVKNGDASLLAIAHEALGIAYIIKDRVDDALREHRIACDLAPNDASIRHNYAVTLRRAGRLVESLEKHLEALKLPGAETAVVLSNAATTLADLGEYDEAVRFMERALELLPGSAHRVPCGRKEPGSTGVSTRCDRFDRPVSEGRIRNWRRRGRRATCCPTGAAGVF